MQKSFGKKRGAENLALTLYNRDTARDTLYSADVSIGEVVTDNRTSFFKIFRLSMRTFGSAAFFPRKNSSVLVARF